VRRLASDEVDDQSSSWRRPTIRLGCASKVSRSTRTGRRRRSPPSYTFTKRVDTAFGMRKQNLPNDHWIERLADWLDVQGLLKK
jgi:hypothetical protein